MTHVFWSATAALFVAAGVAGVAIYAAMLHDDELSSHLSPTMQLGMGKGPYTWKWSTCFEQQVACLGNDWTRHGWDRESYLRSQGRDVTDLCYGEYRRFASQIPWLRGDGYWPQFLNICKIRPADSAARYLSDALTNYVSEACAARIASGWIVGGDGSFSPPNPRAPARLDFVTACLPPSPTGHTTYIHPTMYPIPYLGY